MIYKDDYTIPEELLEQTCRELSHFERQDRIEKRIRTSTVVYTTVNHP